MDRNSTSPEQEAVNNCETGFVPYRNTCIRNCPSGSWNAHFFASGEKESYLSYPCAPCVQPTDSTTNDAVKATCPGGSAIATCPEGYGIGFNGNNQPFPSWCSRVLGCAKYEGDLVETAGGKSVQCYSGYNLVDGECIAVCSAGTVDTAVLMGQDFANGSPYPCLRCEKNVYNGQNTPMTCSGGNAKPVCPNGFAPAGNLNDVGVTVCTAEPLAENCAEYTGFSLTEGSGGTYKCTRCASGYSMHENKCKPAPANCQAQAISPGDDAYRCTQCYSGYTLSNGECISGCQSGYAMKNGVCTKGTNYYNANKSSCYIVTDDYVAWCGGTGHATAYKCVESGNVSSMEEFVNADPTASVIKVSLSDCQATNARVVPNFSGSTSCAAGYYKSRITGQCVQSKCSTNPYMSIPECMNFEGCNSCAYNSAKGCYQCHDDYGNWP